MKQMLDFGFGQPWWLLLLPLLVWWFRRFGNNGTAGAVIHSSVGLLTKLGKTSSGGPGKILRSLLFISLALFSVGMARPRLPAGELPDPSKGIDIMLVVDCSGSMDTQDMVVGAKKISRREALLSAISEFVDGRKNDRIGMVGFAHYTYLLSPLTTDPNWIKEVYKMVVLKSSTAIGDGIIAGVNKLEENPDRTKVMILVTDGANNYGVNPLTAADFAKEKKVRIYALEIKPLQTVVTGDRLKSVPLAQVANKTGGQYFQAPDTSTLVQIYRQIDKMERSEVDNRNFVLYTELYMWFVLPGAALLLFSFISGQTVWLRLP
ncbi:MAG: VWA domain-containing protein [Candidatus Methylacidiphilales bacterium]|nr:VWA domain-containing protein [Candidatus Methylacidiphilales bacterium]